VQGRVLADRESDERRLQRQRDERRDRQTETLAAHLDGEDRHAGREASHDRAQLVAPDHAPII